MNIQSLLSEIYKTLNDLSSNTMSNVFKQNQSIPCELKNCNTFRSTGANSVKYGTETKYIFPLKFGLLSPKQKTTESPSNRLNWRWENGKLHAHVGYVKPIWKVDFIWPCSFLFIYLFIYLFPVALKIMAFKLFWEFVV